MLALPCPTCGAFNPACLPSPRSYRCDSCKYDGPPREQDLPRLEALARTVEAIEERSLQLGKVEAGMLVSARGARAAYLLLFALLLFPTILTTGMVDWVSEVTETPLPILTLAPALIMLAAGITGAVLIHRRHRELMTACAADPPRAGDEVGRCNVCGGPLASKSGSVVARCGFCRADNVVSEETLSKVDRAHVTGIELFERRLRGRQVRGRGAVSRAATLVVATSLIGCALIACSAFSILDRAGDLRRAGMKLVVVQMDDRSCFGEPKGEEVSFGERRSHGLLPSVAKTELRVAPRAPRLSRLSGSEVLMTDGNRARVSKVFLRDGEIWLETENETGVLERTLLGACFLDPSF